MDLAVVVPCGPSLCPFLRRPRSRSTPAICCARSLEAAREHSEYACHGSIRGTLPTAVEQCRNVDYAMVLEYVADLIQEIEILPVKKWRIAKCSLSPY
jgi:hypothetical protein